MLRSGFIVFALALTVMTAWAPRAHAAGGDKGFVGIQGGLAFPSTSSAVFAFGINGMYRKTPRLAFGAFLILYGAGIQTSTDAGTANSETSSSLWGAEVDYFFPDSLKGFRVGARLGILSESTTVAASNSSSSIDLAEDQSPLFLMPMLSYDHMIGRFSVGGEAGYFLGMGHGAPSGFIFMLAPKFWF